MLYSKEYRADINI